MKKFGKMKAIMGIILALAIVMSAIGVIPASAADPYTTAGDYCVQEWVMDGSLNIDRADLNNSNGAKAYEAPISKNNDVYAFSNAWHDRNSDTNGHTQAIRKAENGVYSVDIIRAGNDTNEMNVTNISFKLNQKLNANQNYTFNINMNSAKATWIYDSFIYYSDNLAGTDGSGQSQAKPAPANQLATLGGCNLSTDETTVRSYEFTPAADIDAGKYLNFRIYLCRTDTIYFRGAHIRTNGVKELKADDSGVIEVQNWKMDGPLHKDSPDKTTGNGAEHYTAPISLKQDVWTHSNAWHDRGGTATTTFRKAENGVFSVEVNGDGNDFVGANFSAKLDNGLVAGRTYTFNVNVYFKNTSWVYNQFVFWSDNVAESMSQSANDNIITSNLLASSTGWGGKTDKNNVLSYRFTPTEDIPAGKWINYNIRMRISNTVYFTGANLTTVADPVFELDKDGNFVIQTWTPDGSLAIDSEDKGYGTGANGYTAAISANNDMFTSSNAYHDRSLDNTGLVKVTRSAANGVYKVEVDKRASSGHYSTTNLALKLNYALEAGEEYTLDVKFYTENGAWIYKQFINWSTAKDNGQTSWGYNCADAAPANNMLTVAGFGGPKNSDNVKSYTFTPEVDIPAGHFLNFNVRLCQTDTLYFTGCTLKKSNQIPVTSYDFSLEGDREAIFRNGGEEYTAASGSAEGETAFKKWAYSMQCILPDVVLEENTEYAVNLNTVVSWAGGAVDVYAVKPHGDDVESTDAYYGELDEIGYLIAGNIATVKAGDSNSPEWTEGKFTTAGTDIDFEEYPWLAIAVRPNDKNSNTYVYDIEISKSEKAVRSEVKAEDMFFNNYYNKIALDPDKFASYAIKGEDGEFTWFEGNFVADLQPDTEYTFVVKYADSGRFFASEDVSAEFTFKTLKKGDMNRDNKVDLLDLIRQKKNIGEEITYDETYDINGDNSVNAGDLTVMKQILLG